MNRPEFPVSRITPELFRSCILEQGAVLLRRAVPGRVLRGLQKAAARSFSHYDAIPPEMIDIQVANCGSAVSDYWRQFRDDGALFEHQVIPLMKGRVSLFDVLTKTPLASLLAEGFPDLRPAQDHNTLVRRVGSDRNSDKPLDVHVDAYFHQHQLLGLNCWTPLSPAGGKAPGLQVYTVGVEAAKARLRYDPLGYPIDPTRHICHMHHFRCEELEPEALADLTPWKPKMQPGDVLVFTNFTMHATWAEPHMTRSRTSIEARLMLHPR